MTFGVGGLRYGVNGVERFRRGFRIVFDDDDNVVFEEVVEEFARVSDSEREQTNEIVDYS